jgi:hypothetical protein
MAHSTVIPSTSTAQTFRIFFVIERLLYSVTPIAVQPAVARKAFRVTKHDGHEGPPFLVTAGHVHNHCTCLGFKGNRSCRHVRTLKAARMLD